MHCVFDSLCEMHSLVFVLNRSKVKATFETAFEIVFETFHATFNVFVVKDSSDLKSLSSPAPFQNQEQKASFTYKYVKDGIADWVEAVPV